MVLASHAHPSVATMAGTLLSGANIVYNGNPLNDLTLTAFLDKFMEKKPKQSTWHGGSQIEPAKKVSLNSSSVVINVLRFYLFIRRKLPIYHTPLIYVANTSFLFPA